MPIINPGTGGGTGPQGPQGIPGINGIPGFDGDSGEDGFPIPGSQGAQGSQGIQGVPGINGSQGIPGEDGLSGEDSFIPGPQGLAGTNGTNGAAGTAGARGLDGEDGSNGDDFWPGFNPFIDDPLEQISRIQDRNITILPNYSAVVVGPYTINSGKKLTIGSGGRFQIFQGAPNKKATVFAKQTAQYDQHISTSQERMAGLGATNSTQVITPLVSGNLFVVLSGYIGQFGTPSNIEATIKMYYGTGTPPAANVSPISSIQVGNQIKVQDDGSTAQQYLPFSIPVTISGLQTGTAYWFDISIALGSQLFGVSLFDTNFAAIEL